MILQLKTGRIESTYFRQKYGSDVTNEFADGYRQLQSDGWLNVTPRGAELTPAGLLQIDRHLPVFFDPEYRSSRYA